MNKKSNRTKDLETMNIEHETVTILLDAYTTDELEITERNLVEHHLLHCEECQKSLENILRLRTMLKNQKSNFQEKRTLVINSEGNLADSLVTSVRRSISMNQREEKELMPFKPDVAVQLPSASIRQKRAAKKSRVWLIGVFAAILCITILVITQLPFFSSRFGEQAGRANNPLSQAPSIPWELNREQTVIHNGADVFAIKYIDIVDPNSLRFFYVFHSTQEEEVPQVSVSSLLPHQQNKILKINIQPLGVLGSYQVGVIEVPYIDRVGQTLALEGKFLPKGSLWDLSLLKQVDPSKPARISLYIDQTNMPEITWNFGQSNGKDTIAFFQAEKSKVKNGDLRIFVIVGNSIKKITEAEYQKLAEPSKNSSPCQSCSQPVSPHDAEATVNASQKK